MMKRLQPQTSLSKPRENAQYNRDDEEKENVVLNCQSRIWGTSLTRANLIGRPSLEPYLRSIYNHSVSTSEKNKSSRKPLLKQNEVNKRMRCILFDWLFEVSHRYRFSPKTMALTSNIFDRYLEARPVSRDVFQLVGVVAFFISSKFEEVYPPTAAELCVLCSDSYSRPQLLELESEMLSLLGFNLIHVSPFEACGLLLKLLGDNSTSVETATFFLVELFSYYQHIDRFNSFVVARFCIHYAYVINGRSPPSELAANNAEEFDHLASKLRKVLLYLKIDNLCFHARKNSGCRSSLERIFL